MVKRRRTEKADPAAWLVAYSKRRKGLFRKASELCHLCGAPAAAKPCSFGDPSAEEIISYYIRGDGDVVPPMGLTEWAEWIENECDSSATEEDAESPIAKYDTVHDFVREKLEDLEKNSSVMNGAGGDSGIGLGCNSENLSDQEIDLDFECFKARCPALFEDCLCDGDGDAFLTSPEKSATGGGSLGVDSTSTCSHHECCGFNSGNFLTVSRDCVGNGDGDSFLTLPENLAIGGGSSGEELMLCDGCGFNPEEFLSLFDDCINDSDRDSSFTLLGNSAIGSESSGEESMLCDLEACGFNPEEFLSLLEDCSGDSDRDSFLTLPEHSAIGGGSTGDESMLCDLEDEYDPDKFLTLEDLDVPL